MNRGTCLSRFATLVILITAVACLPTVASEAQVCGDYDCSGSVSTTDLFEIFNLLALETPPYCVKENRDVDDHLEVTIADAAVLYDHIFVSHSPLDCQPDQPPLDIVPSSDFTLTYTHTIPANTTACTVWVDIIAIRPVSGTLVGFLLSVDAVPIESMFIWRFNGASGSSNLSSVVPGAYIMGTAQRLPIGRTTIAYLFWTDTPAPQPRAVSIELMDVDTLLPDTLSRHYSFVSDADFGQFELHSIDDFCPIPITGDGDMSGALTSSDIIALVNYVFKSGPFPLPCAAAGDVNCDTSVTSADVIYLVNHIFKGDAAPCDVCAIYAQSECE